MSEDVKDRRMDMALHTRIRVKAYELYEASGKADGRALEDWLRAEREILDGVQFRYDLELGLRE